MDIESFIKLGWLDVVAPATPTGSLRYVYSAAVGQFMSQTVPIACVTCWLLLSITLL